MSWIPWIAAVHLAGAILWIGGLFAVFRICKEHSRVGGDAFARLQDGLFEWMVQPGLLLVLASGILFILLEPTVLGQQWLQWKLLLVLGLAVVHARLFRLAIAARASAAAPASGPLLSWQLGVGIGLLAVLILSFVRPS